MNVEAKWLWQEKLDFLLVEEAKAFEPAEKFKIQRDIAEARQKLAELTPTVHSSPQPASDSTEVKWTDELRIYGEGFVGRWDELAALDRAWDAGARIFTLHAEGGAGKTRVVVKWLTDMRDAGWRGARRVFVHSFYSQGSDERRNASSELFFEQALAFFGYRGEPITQADERGRTLARLLLKHQGLLVLDGLEPLQQLTTHAEKGRLNDPGIARLLQALANVAPGETRGLCLITSRQPVIELQNRLGASVHQQSLEHLNRDDGAELLQQFHVVGPDEELKKASGEFHGHAYSLMLLGSYLKNATEHHDIRRRGEVVLLDEDTEHSSHARKMFAAYVRHLGEDSPEVAVLRLLGFFDRAAEQKLLDVLRARKGLVYEWSKEEEEANRRTQTFYLEDFLPEMTAPLLALQQVQWLRVLNRLRDLRLIDFDVLEKSPALDAHPLLRECFAEQVRTHFPSPWKAGHRRLFEYLSGTVQYWPEGLEYLQPLYQAVAHGCLAELYQRACDDVYIARILRGKGNEGYYRLHKLGAMGADLAAVTCFFTLPWTILAPSLAPADHAWILFDAAFRLRALGRLTEAVEPMKLALEKTIEQGEWGIAATRASTLSALELLRGDIWAATNAGERSISYADRSGDKTKRVIISSSLGATLHQAGRHAEAKKFFEDAEFQQALSRPEYPRLLSVRSYRYCEFLLSEAERAAWRRCLSETIRSNDKIAALLLSCNAVSERATQNLASQERPFDSLDPALDFLTMALSEFYKAQLLSVRPQPLLADIAITNLRAVGTMHFLPRGLVTRAWIRCF